MAIDTVTMRNALVDAYKAQATHFSLHSADATSGNELAVTRQAANWGATSASAATASPAAFTITSGMTVGGAGAWSALSGGTFLDGAALTSQTFASNGTYTVTATYTQS